LDGGFIHLIGGLHLGGAETVLCRLLDRTDQRRFPTHVVTLRPGGELVDRVRSAGVRLTSLDFRAASAPLEFTRLVHLLRRERPAALVTWMYHANLIGSLAAQSVGGIPTVWNIRHADLPPGLVKRTTRTVIRLGAICSHRLPTAIVHVSQSGRRWHQQLGYADKQTTVIPNGFDLNQFHPSLKSRLQLRAELGLSSAHKLIGHVGRFHPNKDHYTFLRAAAILQKSHPDVRFVLCGTNVSWDNRQVTEWIDELQLRSAVHLLGPRADMERIQAGLDLLVSSSISEGFPNVVGEAMACGVPCIVTDVADSSLLVGDTGAVVPAGQPSAIADACNRLLAESRTQRERRSTQARQRVATHFEFSHLADRHFELWSRVAQIEGCTPPLREAA
jgi:glycosyltransferase involved in cell wall biosynthesis